MSALQVVNLLIGIAIIAWLAWLLMWERRWSPESFRCWRCAGTTLVEAAPTLPLCWDCKEVQDQRWYDRNRDTIKPWAEAAKAERDGWEATP